MNMGNDSNNRLPKLHDHTTLYVKEINILRSCDAYNADRYNYVVVRLVKFTGFSLFYLEELFVAADLAPILRFDTI